MKMPMNTESTWPIHCRHWMILGALSVTRVGADGIRSGIMAVGVKRKTLNVETLVGYCHD